LLLALSRQAVLGGIDCPVAWDKEVLSARGLKRVRKPLWILDVSLYKVTQRPRGFRWTP
jgi:hypothetical protein